MRSNRRPVEWFVGEYEFLSNFFWTNFVYRSRMYPTAEHAFQAAKANGYHGERWVRVSPTPGIAKRRGRKVELREDWEEIKLQVMEDVVRAKFAQNQELANKLLDTEDSELNEGNYWHDNFWGNCLCPKCAEQEGENHLGKILMKIREELRNLGGKNGVHENGNKGKAGSKVLGG